MNYKIVHSEEITNDDQFKIVRDGKEPKQNNFGNLEAGYDFVLSLIGNKDVTYLSQKSLINELLELLHSGMPVVPNDSIDPTDKIGELERIVKLASEIRKLLLRIEGHLAFQKRKPRPALIEDIKNRSVAITFFDANKVRRVIDFTSKNEIEEWLADPHTQGCIRKMDREYVCKQISEFSIPDFSDNLNVNILFDDGILKPSKN